MIARRGSIDSLAYWFVHLLIHLPVDSLIYWFIRTPGSCTDR